MDIQFTPEYSNNNQRIIKRLKYVKIIKKRKIKKYESDIKIIRTYLGVKR
jgi:hypothetical protein